MREERNLQVQASDGKMLKPLFGLRLKKGKRHEQALPCSAIPSTPVAPKASQTRLDELTCAPCFMTP